MEVLEFFYSFLRTIKSDRNDKQDSVKFWVYFFLLYYAVIM